MRKIYTYLCALLILPTYAANADQLVPPVVVATITPIHSLIAGTMEGVGEPLLLIEGAGSPHGHVLKPSEAQALEQADIIFWVGPEMETFLSDALEALGKRATIVELAKPIEANAQTTTRDPHGHEAHGHDAHGHDPHIWLDPRGAQEIVRSAVHTLATLDKPHAATYQANGTRLVAQLTKLEHDIKEKLAEVHAVPFIVFHDAYAPFEDRFGIRALASVTTGADRPPGAAHVRKLRTLIQKHGVRCVFAEPQFEPQLIQPLIEGTDVEISVLDPLGAGIAPGPELYFALMRQLANNLSTCLAGSVRDTP